MPQFFIDRPVFAWVIAILITLMGAIAISRLPADAYPNIAPPQINISAVYPGADANAVEQAELEHRLRRVQAKAQRAAEATVRESAAE